LSAVSKEGIIVKKIKVSVIHTEYLDVPHEASPGSNNFSESAALAYVNDNINKTLEYVKKAGQAGSDLVCTHEDFINSGLYVRDFDNPLFASIVKHTYKQIREQMSSLAKQYSMLIATNNYEEHNGDIYNTSTVYGRNGEILGQYRKVHLADSENWRAVPGDTFNVIETDIGKIGFAICYDMIFPESCRMLALNGADIIIHQTQGWGTMGKGKPIVGESFMRVRAAENSVYLIVAKVIQGREQERSMVIDNFGNIIAESDVLTEELLTVEFEPDYNMIEPYHFNSYFSGVPSIKARQLLARRPQVYNEITDQAPCVMSKYKEYKLNHAIEDAKRVMEKWESIPDEEQAKYYW